MQSVERTIPDRTEPTGHPSERFGLKRVVGWLMALLLAVAIGFAAVLSGSLPEWAMRYDRIFLCGLTGGVGGIVYCMRGVYLNACVRKTWDTTWLPWYFIRPITSVICGFVSYALLKAGLLLLDSTPRPDSNSLGFYVLAFVAGLNVDKFVAKIENLALTTWGIEKSNASPKERNG
jgi:hypothetical protein